MTKSKMLPFLPEEKSNHAPFWSLTKKDGVFSGLKGESPFHSRPAFFSCTRRRTTSDTGNRARISSMNPWLKRIVMAALYLSPKGSTLAFARLLGFLTIHN